MGIEHITLVEEFWPGQREGLATARIEARVEGEERPVEVGRITAERELFNELRTLIESTNELDR